MRAVAPYLEYHDRWSREGRHIHHPLATSWYWPWDGYGYLLPPPHTPLRTARPVDHGRVLVPFLVDSYPHLTPHPHHPHLQKAPPRARRCPCGDHPHPHLQWCGGCGCCEADVDCRTSLLAVAVAVDVSLDRCSHEKGDRCSPSPYRHPYPLRRGWCLWR